MDKESFKKIAENLSPERPIRSLEHLRGRISDLENVERELRYFHATPFIYGYRGVGKTSLARTAAQQVTLSDREHIYVACAPGARLLNIFREIGEGLLKLAFKLGGLGALRKTVEVEVSLTPAIRASFENTKPELPAFDSINAAVRLLKDLDTLIPEATRTVVVLDELESLDPQDRGDLAYFIKQLGDQEFKLKFILVGIAENVHELIGAHESVPRYIKEVPLQPLNAQSLMDIVDTAAKDIQITVPEEILMRIAIIGNGFPHFAHLMGKALLIEAILASDTTISADIYQKGVARAVSDSLQELRITYDAATQRGGDYFKHLIWALAHSDVVDVRTDDWIKLFEELADKYHWSKPKAEKLRYAIGNFKAASYGKIITNTPARYGSVEMRYRYKRFTNMLMRGHVRLQAANEGFHLGRQITM